MLRDLGFVVSVTSNARRTSNSPGTADIFVYKGAGSWIAIDFKAPSPGRPKGEMTKKQKEMWRKGMVSIATTPDEALRIVLEREVFHGRAKR